MRARRTNLDIMVEKMNTVGERKFHVGYDAAGLSKGTIRWKYCLMEGEAQITKWRSSKAQVLDDIRGAIAKRKARAA